LTAAERAAVESLTDAEVDAIVSAKNKLGGAFIKKHVPHGMMF
jgi:predicted lactoylglutathione lyase